MNWFDKVIGVVNPKAAFERQRYRVAMEIMEGHARKYDGASGGRRNDNWKASNSSVNTETYYALEKLRNRSRDMVRNNPYARKIVKTLPHNIVGTGIRPTPITDSKQTSKKVKQLWKSWAEKTSCDFDGMHNIYGLQKLAMRTVMEGGEVLVLRRRVNNPMMPIQLQVVEGDLIDSQKNMDRTGNGEGYIMQGIEFNGEGRKVAVWLFDKHPGEQFRFPVNITSKRVPVEDVLHIFQVERPGQVRGIPIIVASMMRLKDFDEYEDAQLMRQKIAACFSVFVMDSQDSVIKGDTKAVDMAERVEPGIIEHLPPGKDVKFASPPGADGYADYSRKVQQGIAAGAGITYEAMTGDLSNVNFSSGRMGWIEMQREIEDWQWNVFVPQFCDKVWEWFNSAAIIAGSLRSTVEVTWTTPRRMMLDPVKETNAKVTQIGAGLTTLTEALAEDGYEFDEVMEQKAKEQAKLKELGITLVGTMAPEPQQVEVTN